jgi:hypothetical protein
VSAVNGQTPGCILAYICGLKGHESIASRLLISANLIPGPLMGEWLLSPEGQAESSQARSAWVAMQRASVPA